MRVLEQLKEKLNLSLIEKSLIYLRCENCGYEYRAKNWNPNYYLKDPIGMVKSVSYTHLTLPTN